MIRIVDHGICRHHRQQQAAADQQQGRRRDHARILAVGMDGARCDALLAFRGGVLRVILVGANRRHFGFRRAAGQGRGDGAHQQDSRGTGLGHAGIKSGDDPSNLTIFGNIVIFLTGVEKEMAQKLSLICSVKGRAIDHNFIQFKFRRISTF